MQSLRRWWGRNSLALALAAASLSVAWAIRQTHGALVMELYQVISQPLGMTYTQTDRLTDARVRELQFRLTELERQNESLQGLLDYKPLRSGAGIAAPVIGRSADHWWQQITLGRGQQEGIRPGSVVVGPGGLVGRVTSVSPSTSRVLLISDPSSQVGVVITRSRHMGVLRGKAGNRAVIEFFDKDPDVRRGDVVMTSSLSSLFPSGIAVGRVETLNLEKSPAPEAQIELSVPISYLEWVIVYPGRPQGR
ncbi:rod shape-determining protein MreC [Leptolyngbya sp. FACHB-261]|uniref:rod shape-determining protein MreC n=1 Tax=Leptolyngbya sp. FACHB-261 TaxID=2692806 RepID=UPI0016828494|nr:rod shape-determining protein MreC [Leptolyngbya sp. FACHB-261]MBD2101821.1 rod shape-determining protein MreC [Leptolyngbya sp. FACHB-261]